MAPPVSISSILKSRQSLDLCSLTGVPKSSLRAISLPSPSWVSVVDASKHVAVVDVEQNTSYRFPFAIDEAALDPSGSILATRVGKTFTLFDIKTSSVKRTFTFGEDIVFSTWLSPKLVALIGHGYVYHWDVQEELRPAVFFRRCPELTGSEIVAYVGDTDLSWFAVSGISQRENGTWRGVVQLYAKQQGADQVIQGHACAFVHFVASDFKTRRLLCVAARTRTGGSFTVVEAPNETNNSDTVPAQISELPFPVDGGADYPVAVVPSDGGIAFVVTKYGICALYELETATLIYSASVVSTPVLGAVRDSLPHTLVLATADGLLHDVEAKDFLSIAAGKNPQAGVLLACRNYQYFSKARSLLNDLFLRSVIKGNYSAAAFIAVQAPSDMLRGKAVMELVIKNGTDPMDTGQGTRPERPSAPLQYVEELTALVPLTRDESIMFCATCLEEKDGLVVLVKLLNGGLINTSEEVEHLVQGACPYLAPIVRHTRFLTGCDSNVSSIDSLPFDDMVALYTKYACMDFQYKGLTRPIFSSTWASRLRGAPAVVHDRISAHFDVFDVNKDGIIYFWEQYRVVATAVTVLRCSTGQFEPYSAEDRPVQWELIKVIEMLFRGLDPDGTGLAPTVKLLEALRDCQELPGLRIDELEKHLEVRAEDGYSRFQHLLSAIGGGYFPDPTDRTVSEATAPPDMAPTMAPAADAVDDLFKAKCFKAFLKYDSDGEGVITKEQLGELLQSMVPTMTQADINRLFLEMDSDKSGLISYEEFFSGVITLGLKTEDFDRLALYPTSSLGHGYEWEIPYAQLQIGDKLGEGSYGVVYKAIWNGTTVAVKKLKHKELTEAVLDDFRKEVAMLGKLRHPNVVLFMGASTISPNFTMVTEYMDGGSLFDIIYRKKVVLDFPAVVEVSIQAARGLLYLHRRQPAIVHRDLKSLNLLTDLQGTVKICDFGLSSIKKANAPLDEQVGTPTYMAPELLLSRPYNEKVDVYAFGMCMYEMMMRKLPFPGKSFRDVQQLVAKEGKRPPMNADVPVGMAMLIEECWQQDPASRPSMDQVLARLEVLQASQEEVGRMSIAQAPALHHHPLPSPDPGRKPSLVVIDSSSRQDKRDKADNLAMYVHKRRESNAAADAPGAKGHGKDKDGAHAGHAFRRGLEKMFGGIF